MAPGGRPCTPFVALMSISYEHLLTSMLLRSNSSPRPRRNQMYH